MQPIDQYLEDLIVSLCLCKCQCTLQDIEHRLKLNTPAAWIKFDLRINNTLRKKFGQLTGQIAMSIK